MIFLDIDGTLNDYSYAHDPLAPWLMEKQCRCFAGLILRLQENTVVLTTSRRFMFDYKQWGVIFQSHGINLNIHGRIEKGSWDVRKEGILSYTKNPDFIILDDLNLNMDQQLVVIDPRFGLTPKDVDRICVRIGR